MKKSEPSASRRAAGLTVTMLLVWLAWDTPAAYPLRLLTTFLHEIGHGMASVVTGGAIHKITVESNGSGLCWTEGGWRWFTIMGGYLGSMFFGSVILVGALRTRFHKLVTFCLGAGILLISLFYVPWSNFGFGAGLLIGLALASSGWWLSSDANQLLSTFLGTAVSIQAVFDIRTIFQIGAWGTDAGAFSREVFPLPAKAWALIWGALALVWLYGALRFALTGRLTRIRR